eukprot:1127712-Amphidinium_carterae.2
MKKSKFGSVTALERHCYSTTHVGLRTQASRLLRNYICVVRLEPVDNCTTCEELHMQSPSTAPFHKDRR